MRCRQFSRSSLASLDRAVRNDRIHHIQRFGRGGAAQGSNQWRFWFLPACVPRTAHLRIPRPALKLLHSRSRAIAHPPADRSMARLNLKNFRRIVVKVGSSLLIDSDAGEVRASWLAALAVDLAKLHDEGRELLIVSSGSIALGRSRLKLPRGALKLEESQGAAAVGQIALARIWSEVLGAHGIGAGQIGRASCR